MLFSGFLVGNLGFGVFREHGWATWDRLRASQLDTAELMLGKSVAPVLTLALQLTVMLGAGSVLFDLHIRGSLLAFVAVAVALSLMEVGLAFVLLAICRSVLQLNAATNLGAMLLAGIGGAVTPIYLLPSWAQRAAPLTPAYWAMRGFRTVVIEGGGVRSVALPIGMLLGFAVGFAAIAAVRFGVEEAKVSWA